MAYSQVSAMLPNRETVVSKAWVLALAIPFHVLSDLEHICRPGLYLVTASNYAVLVSTSPCLVVQSDLASGFSDA